MKENLLGGEFLIKNQRPEDIFIREELTEDAKNFSAIIEEFITKKVAPNFAKIDKGDYALLVELLREAGSMGILNAGLPEEFGGMNIDFTTETAMSEEIGKSHSFSVASAAHTGIGTLPILYFGTENQKNTYLEKLGTGEKWASYCLTEPWSGSDAMGARTKAVLTEDQKHYILNGQKMWITNAGFADVFTVFAQIDGIHFSAFIVDKDTPGMTLGMEEDKLGIKGSSTRQVFFENVKIPVENLLGEIGKGHKIAFNVLNIGRYKLCIMALGGCKSTFEYAVKYALERKQFGKSIAEFGAIQEKIAQMGIKIFGTESACYRVGGLIETMITQSIEEGMSKIEAKKLAAEEYSIECAALKVIGSESLDYISDETLQIYGGMGYSEEAPAARCYRDSRINRIFEGTNEINRLLTVSAIVKKAMRGKLNLLDPTLAAQKELLSIDLSSPSKELFEAEIKTIIQSKKALLLIAGAALDYYKQTFESQQEIMMKLADIAYELFVSESVLLRIQKLHLKSPIDIDSIYYKILTCQISESMDIIYIKGKTILSAFASNDQYTMLHMALKRFTKYPVLNTIEAKRNIAAYFLEKGRYQMN